MAPQITKILKSLESPNLTPTQAVEVELQLRMLGGMRPSGLDVFAELQAIRAQTRDPISWCYDLVMGRNARSFLGVDLGIPDLTIRESELLFPSFLSVDQRSAARRSRSMGTASRQGTESAE